VESKKLVENGENKEINQENLEEQSRNEKETDGKIVTEEEIKESS